MIFSCFAWYKKSCASLGHGKFNGKQEAVVACAPCLSLQTGNVFFFLLTDFEMSNEITVAVP